MYARTRGIEPPPTMRQCKYLNLTNASTRRLSDRAQLTGFLVDLLCRDNEGAISNEISNAIFSDGGCASHQQPVTA